MSEASDNLADSAVEYQISLLRVEAGMRKKTVAALEQLEGDITGILAKNKNLSAGKKAKLEEMLIATNDAILGTFKQIGKTSLDDLEGVATATTKKTVNDLSGQVGVSLGALQLSAPQLTEIVRGPVIEGNPIEAWWGAQADGTQRRLAGAVRQGMLLGDDMDTIARTIRGTKAANYEDGILSVTRRESQAIARTAVQSVANQAKIETLKNSSDVVKGIEWVATLDNRTTPTCRALDGLQWRLPDFEPVGHDKKFPGSIAHWGCRSTQIAVTRSWSELAGKTVPGADQATFEESFRANLEAAGKDEAFIQSALANQRASMDGTVSSGLNFDAWARGKGDTYIRNLLGPGRFALWKSGNLKMTDLTDQAGRELTIAQLQAAVDGGALPAETEGSPFLDYIAPTPESPLAWQPSMTPEDAAAWATGPAAALLQHRTSEAAAKAIKAGGFKIGTGEGLGTNIYGNGVYVDEIGAELSPTSMKKFPAVLTVQYKGAPFADYETWKAANETLKLPKAENLASQSEAAKQAITDYLAAQGYGGIRLFADGEAVVFNPKDLVVVDPTAPAAKPIEAAPAAESSPTPTPSNFEDTSTTPWEGELEGKVKNALKAIDAPAINKMTFRAALQQEEANRKGIFYAPDGTMAAAMAWSDNQANNIVLWDVGSVQKGGGTMALQRLFNEAAAQGKGIVGTSLDDAAAFYEKLGFKVDKATGKISMDPATVASLATPTPSPTPGPAPDQGAAAATIADTIANPTGKTLLAKALTTLQKSEPNLTPVEMLAKAQGIAAEKQAAASKAAALSMAKKKILEGGAPTPAQQAVIDGLTPEEAASWKQSIDDAKDAGQGKILEALLAKLEAQEAAGIKPTAPGAPEWGQLTGEHYQQAQKASHDKQKVWESAAKQEILDGIQFKVDYGETLALNDKEIEWLKQLPSDQQNEIFDTLNKAVAQDKIDSTLLGVFQGGYDEAAAVKTINDIGTKYPEMAEAGLNDLVVWSVNQKVKNELEALAKGDGPAAKFAAEILADDSYGPGNDKTWYDAMEVVKESAEIQAKHAIDQAVVAGSKVTKLKQAAFKAATGIDPAKDPLAATSYIANLEYSTGEATELLQKIETVAGEKQAAASLASKLSTAKAKIVAGKEPSPSEQAAIDSLDADAKAKWEASVEEGKAAAGKGFKQPADPPMTVVGTNESALPMFQEQAYLDKINGLNKTEKAAVTEYTLSDYSIVNEFLNGSGYQHGSTKVMAETAAKKLDVVMSQFPLPKPIVVKRGIDKNHPLLQQWPGNVIGTTYTELGYLSTTVADNADPYFATAAEMEIHVPAGIGAIYTDPISANKGENEVLLQRGITFDVVSIDTLADGKKKIVLHAKPESATAKPPLEEAGAGTAKLVEALMGDNQEIIDALAAQGFVSTSKEKNFMKFTEEVTKYATSVGKTTEQLYIDTAMMASVPLTGPTSAYVPPNAPTATPAPAAPPIRVKTIKTEAEITAAQNKFFDGKGDATDPQVIQIGAALYPTKGQVANTIVDANGKPEAAITWMTEAGDNIVIAQFGVLGGDKKKAAALMVKVLEEAEDGGYTITAETDEPAIISNLDALGVPFLGDGPGGALQYGLLDDEVPDFLAKMKILAAADNGTVSVATATQAVAAATKATKAKAPTAKKALDEAAGYLAAKSKDPVVGNALKAALGFDPLTMGVSTKTEVKNVLQGYLKASGTDIATILNDAKIQAAAVPKTNVPPPAPAKVAKPSSKAPTRQPITVDKASIPDPSTLKVQKKLGGSTGAQLAVAPDGSKWVVKKGNNQGHVRAEAQADDIYRALGFKVPEGRIFETPDGPVKVTRFLEGAKPLGSLSGYERQAAYDKLKDGFAADAVLGNWDVVGMGADNVMVSPDGEVWRIDNGGSMEFRAQGDVKSGTEWNDYPTEIWSMRDAAANGSTAAAYGDMGIHDIAKSIEAIDWTAIEKVADIPPGTKETILRRAQEAQRIASRALDFERDNYKESYTEKVAKAGLEMRQSGVIDGAPKKFNVQSNYSITDENGRSFGNLRSGKGKASPGMTQVKLLPGDNYAGTIESAFKSINHKASSGSNITEGTALAKANAALALKPALETAAKDKGEIGKMAKQYLTNLEWIQAQVTKGGVPTKLSAAQYFKPYEPAKKSGPAAPAPPPVDTRSVVERWEAEMAAKGIGTGPITQWLSEQSGNSWSEAAQVAKYAWGRHLEGAEKSQYWSGNNIKTSYAKCKKAFEDRAKAMGGTEKLDELFSSYHALIQEVLTTFEDVPWIDAKRRAVLLFRTVSRDELDGSGVPKSGPGSSGGEFIPFRGVTESHSIYERTSVKGRNLTVAAVPFTRIHGIYWLERHGGQGGCSFLGDGEGEFAANTSGIPSIFDNSYDNNAPSLTDPKSQDATTWRVPLTHLER